MTIEQARAAHVYIPPKAEGSVAISPSETMWPVVEFLKSRYATGIHYPRTLVPQLSVDVINARGTAEATRHQVPLILAWWVASNVHRVAY